MAHHAEPGEPLPEPHAVHLRLPLQGQDAVHAHLLEPWHEEGHVPVCVHDRLDAPLLEPGDQPAVAGREELLEHPLRDHGAVVVGHIFGDGHEGGDADLQDLVEEAEVEFEEIGVDPVDELRLVVEGEAHPLEVHQGPGEPEEPLESAPDHRLAPALEIGPGAHRLYGLAVRREEAGPDPEVVIHRGDDPLHVVLRGLDGGVGGAEPELLVGIEAEVAGDLKDPAVRQRGRQPFAMPPGDGLVPPHGPLPPREPVHGLEAHHGPEALDVVHRRCHRSLLNFSIRWRGCSSPGPRRRGIRDRGAGQDAAKMRWRRLFLRRPLSHLCTSSMLHSVDSHAKPVAVVAVARMVVVAVRAPEIIRTVVVERPAAQHARGAFRWSGWVVP